jgi:UDP-2,4-diacetamido-2,4,6-trideoxy-beta-L-altropyranose hydrolase
VRFVVPQRTRDLLLGDGIAPDLILDAARDWLAAGISAVITDINWHGNGLGASIEVAALAARGASVAMIDCVPPDEYVDQPTPPALILTPYLNARALRPVPPNAPWQAGARFTILSPDYFALRAHPPARGARILVTCGGSDPDGFSFDTVDALLESRLPLDVIIGPLFDAATRARLAELAIAHPQITLHDAPATLAPLIAAASLVVGRAGLIRYEAACLGTYGLYLAGGDAYAQYFRGFTDRGFAEIYQEGQNGSRNAYLQRLCALADPAVRAPLMQRNAAAMAAVDGNGAANVIYAVLTLIKP